MPPINRAETVRSQTQKILSRLLRNNPLAAPLTDYIADDSFNRLGPNTRLSYLRDLERFARTVLGESPTNDDVRAFLARHQRRGFSAATLIRMDSSIRRFLAFQDHGRLPSPNTDMLAVLDKTKPSRFLSVDDVSRLLDNAQEDSNTRNAGLIAVAAGTGATGDQIVALNREDVLTDNGVVVKLGIPKPRPVSLASPFREILAAHAQTREPGQPLFRRDRNDRDGDLRLTFGGLSRVFHSLGAEIDWPGLNPKDFRRFFLSQHQPTSTKEIAELLNLSRDRALSYL